MDGWNFLILFALFAGHCELMAFWINRLHALRVSRFWLKLSQRSHDFLLVAFLPFMLWRYGWSAPGLMNGGSWFDLPGYVQAYLAFCSLGVVSLLVAIARQWISPGEPIVDRQRIDVAGKVGPGATGPGWRGWVAGLPGNEVTKLEVNEKRLVCPNLPAEWEGLSIAHFSDLHFHGPVGLDYFQYVFQKIGEMNADMVCFTGDLLDDAEFVAWIPETFAALQAPLGCWFILGNHDGLFDHESIRNRLRALGWQDVGNPSAVLRHAGGTVWIGGDETPWLGEPFEPPAEGLADFRILLSHTPDHFGRAARAGIDLVLAGHTHGGQVRLPLIGPVYAPSRYGVRYAGGTYFRRGSVMHVSRGVSAKRPLRWRCPPEVTRIQLVREGRSEILAGYVPATETQDRHQE